MWEKFMLPLFGVETRAGSMVTTPGQLDSHTHVFAEKVKQDMRKGKKNWSGAHQASCAQSPPSLCSPIHSSRSSQPLLPSTPPPTRAGNKKVPRQPLPHVRRMPQRTKGLLRPQTLAHPALEKVLTRRIQKKPPPALRLVLHKLTVPPHTATCA